MAIGDVYKVAIFSQFGDQQGINVLHWVIETETSPSGPGGLDLGLDLSANLPAFYKAVLCDVATYTGLSVQRIKPTPPLQPQVFTAGAGPGNGGANPLPKQVAGLISKRTAVATRHGRGRMYIPFPAEENNTTAPQPSLVYIGTLQSLATYLTPDRSYTNGFGTTIFRPVVYDRVSTFAIRILSWQPRDRWATQRRRGAFGRPNPAEIPGVPIG